MVLHDAQAAAAKIASAIKADKQIFIHGDYDVDGVCATAIVWDFLHNVAGAKVLPYIPSRFDTGYGLTEQSLDHLVEQGAELIITVDCGIRDAELVQSYLNKGLEFVITDHHELNENADFPDDVPIVHPGHPQGSYPMRDVCGALVAWKLMCAVNDELGLGADMGQYLDLVAMATVCDVMPLTDENRVVVTKGINSLRQQQRPGMQALMQVAKLAPQDLQAYHFGFVLGPRINAAGRLESAMQALRLLSTAQLPLAQQYAAELDALNSQRQDQTQQLLEAAEAEIVKLPPNQKLYFIYGQDWPEGIVGLIAGKLTEKYYRPVLIGSLNSEGTIVGSARSIPAFHIADALNSMDNHLERHGGHAQAAGFTVKQDKVEQLRADLIAKAEAELNDEDLTGDLRIDVVTTPGKLSIDDVKELDKLEPFGFKNPKPIVALDEVEVAKVRIFGKQKQHISFTVTDGNAYVDGVAFNQADRFADIVEGDIISVAGSPGINEWNGRQSVQIIIKDIQR